MNKILFLSLIIFLYCMPASAQKVGGKVDSNVQDSAMFDTITVVDTIHHRKIYYTGGTGLSFPMGRTNETLGVLVFTSTIGMDISLKNPKYFLQPTLYSMAFSFDQLNTDTKYNTRLENARARVFALSLAGGLRRQLKRLNAYTFLGPAICLDVEPRSNIVDNSLVKIKNSYALGLATNLGVGADYRFPSFFIFMEANYMHHFRKIQSRPVNIFSLMVGVKTDITKISEKVVKILNVKHE